LSAPKQVPALAGLRTHHISLHVYDLEGSLHLYRDVLGMKIVTRSQGPSQELILLDVGDGTHVELTIPIDGRETPVPSQTPWRHLALGVKDTRTAIELVRDAGYPVLVEPKDVQLGTLNATVAFFQGPNGESIEFFQTHAP